MRFLQPGGKESDCHGSPLSGETVLRDMSAGLTLLELMLVVAIGVVLLGLAVPSTLNSLKNYHLHSDTTSVASYLNLTRMRAASQYAPYSLDFSPTTNTYIVEQLTPIAYNPIPTSLPSSPNYSSQSPAVYEFGTQYLASGETLADCLPAGSTVYPAPVSGNPSTCSGSFQIYFNTRGFPVDSTGSPLTNGGVAIYLTGPNGLLDALTISSGGAVQTWNWNAGTSQWSAR